MRKCQIKKINGSQLEREVSREVQRQSQSVTMLMSTLFLVFCLAITAQSNTVKEFQDEVPGHEGQCASKDKTHFYKLGETINDGEPCTRKICRGTAAPGSVYVEVQKCAKVEKQPGCDLKEDTKKSYPDCCARLECKHTGK